MTSEHRTILQIDSDEAFGQVLQPLLGRDYLLLQESSLSGAVEMLRSEPPDAILLNLDTDGQDEAALLHAASDREVPLPVIAYSWEAMGERALNAFKAGAFDILTQPLDVQQLRFALDRACRRSVMARELADTRRLLGTRRVEGLLGNSKPMERVAEVTEKVAEVFTSVLITGESGT